ncbi:MAG: formate/nitrite transporter family protein [Acidobacteriota bacterium]
MAERAETAGVLKTRLDTVSLVSLAVLAGAFIGLGAMNAIVVSAGAAGVLPYGLTQLLKGAAFSVGLMLVVVGGAELFTGNNLMVMAWASRRVTGRELLRAWGLVYAGNFLGAAATATLVFLAGSHEYGRGAVGAAALALAQSKGSLPFASALFSGVLCNVLVCLAVWLCYSAHSTTDRLLAIMPPVTAFVAAGFEHSVANMFVLPLGLLIKYAAGPEFWSAANLDPGTFAALAPRTLVANLLPVTLGNVIGGGGLVGAVYWFVYLRRRKPADAAP